MKNKTWWVCSAIIACFIFCSGFLYASPADSIPERKPMNILLFTADDLHRNSLGCFGSTVPDISPNIDRFASQSMKFERAFVNAAICVPARAIIATGLYGNRSGVNGFFKIKEGNNIPLIMEIIRKHNYAVGILGKVTHSTPKKEFTWDFQEDQENLGWGRSPNLYYEKTKLFLADCKDKDKPFYLMVNSHDPHRPFYNPDETVEMLAAKTNTPIERMKEIMKQMEVPSRLYSPNEIEVPDFLPDLPGVRRELSYYYNSTKRLDDTFGKVMQALEESGAAENTVVIFIGDNGMAFPFAKANVYYASNLTPLIINWPGITKKGAVNNEDLVSIVDFMPTILQILNIPSPGNLDGKSFLPLLKGLHQRNRDRAFMEIDYKNSGGPTPMRSIVTKRWIYIYNAWSDDERVYGNNNEGQTMKAMEETAKIDLLVDERIKTYRLRMPEELYDISVDPGCTQNLISDLHYRKMLRSLKKELEEWMVRTNDPLLNVYRNRANPELALKTFYKAYPEAVILDTDKKTYSKHRVAAGD
jgi:N-sulfoglucosamine sulfohydrolase